MRTRRLPLSEASIEEAAAALAAGRLVAFPTETVYGLGARADRADAVRRIFEAKGRPPGNPLIVHAADRDGARALAAEWPGVAEGLAGAFWPGPLTLVVTRAPGAVADEVTAGGPTVAVRVPAHPVALALLRAARVPVAAPSANRSTTISPTTAEHVLKTLEGAVDVVLDGGPTGFGIESTIVDVTRSPMRLLRHGAIPLAALAVFGEIVDVTAQTADPSARADAPGMHAKHYAPRARALLVPPEDVRPLVEARRASGERVGVIEVEAHRASGDRAGVEAHRASGEQGAIEAVASRASGERGAIDVASGTASEVREVLPCEPEGYARELYAALHRLDDAGCDVIVIARVPDEPAWAAVRDRLRRATAE